MLSSLGHEVGEADVDLTGLGNAFRVMVDSESAAIEVESPDLSAIPIRAGAMSAARTEQRSSTFAPNEEMIRRSREIIAETQKWDCLLTPTVTLPPQPLDTFLADTERVAADDLA